MRRTGGFEIAALYLSKVISDVTPYKFNPIFLSALNGNATVARLELNLYGKSGKGRYTWKTGDTHIRC